MAKPTDEELKAEGFIPRFFLDLGLHCPRRTLQALGRSGLHPKAGHVYWTNACGDIAVQRLEEGDEAPRGNRERWPL